MIKISILPLIQKTFGSDDLLGKQNPKCQQNNKGLNFPQHDSLIINVEVFQNIIINVEVFQNI